MVIFTFSMGAAQAAICPVTLSLKKRFWGAEGGRGKISTDSVTFQANGPIFAWIHNDL